MNIINVLFGLLGILFLYLNFSILKSDFQNKIIPNKYLIYLLYIIPHFYILMYISGYDFSYIKIFIEIFIAFLISFGLYYYGVWSAGDAKYLLVLSLFIPQLGIIPLIGNISLITLAYLLLYFLYFYLLKSIFKPEYGKSLFINMKNDLSEKLKYYLINKGGVINKKTTILKIVKLVVFFLILFVTLRLIRIYFINSFHGFGIKNISETQGFLGYLYDFATNHYSYLFFIGIIIFIGLIFLIKKLYIYIRSFIINKYKHKLSNVIKIDDEHIDLLSLILLGITLLGFIYSQYTNNPTEILNSLKLIFTYYILMWLLMKVLFYLYRVAFQISEQDIIELKNLKVGDIVDLPFLIKNFSTEKCLGAYGNKKGLLYPSPIDSIKQIDVPITKESLKFLKNIYKICNNYHKKENEIGHEPLTSIKILKTFAFSGYIFSGLIITFIYGEEIFKYVIDTIISILKSLYN